MALALQDLQSGNVFNRINLSSVQDSTFPFETKKFINQFRGSPAGDALSNTLATAYAIGGSGVSDVLNGTLGINLHIAESLGLDNFAKDFNKMSVGLRQAKEDAMSIANADTDALKNFIGGFGNLVTSLPWLAAGPGGLTALVASAGATTYGNEYIQGRMSGLSIPQAGSRASIMSAIEMVTERLGLSELGAMLKMGLKNTRVENLAKEAGESLISLMAKYGTKEQFSELAAFNLQVAVDKFASFGLMQDLTGMEYLKGALDTIQQTFIAAGAQTGLAIGIYGNKTPNNSGQIKIISPDKTQGLVELGNGSLVRFDLPSNVDLKVGDEININATKNDVVYVPDNVNEK
ncbi:MAG: hypothetical protein EBR82_87565, partial [Caulobacteraceae bacterium]|nr:hypothetical protein [Caulobacteraceae bacterium]